MKLQAQTEKPNIVILYFDDLGYGDVSAYVEKDKVPVLKTPNFDRLAASGLRFTQGYASSATCTPSRYALLTGVYPWRNQNAKILPGTAPLIIDPKMQTLPKVLKSVGYQTAVIGKWHLGLGSSSEPMDWNQPIKPGPKEVGFDESFILAATQDRVPTVYIENGKIKNLDPKDPIEVSYEKNFEGEPTGLDNPELLKLKWHHGHNQSIVNGIPRIGFMKGGKAALWEDETMGDVFVESANRYVKETARKKEPFFLYFALHQPHVPRTPHPRFKGKSGLGPRGDVILEADWCVGNFLDTLEKEGLLENTLILLSSDNGPVLNDGYYDQAVELTGNHQPAGPLRGGKYSLFEAGTRVPFLVSWKGKIQPGVSNAMVCQMDLLASFAQLTGAKFEACDSENVLPALLGQSQEARQELILEASSRTALRSGDWALIPPYPGRPAIAKNTQSELGNASGYQLYNLKEDLGQKTNLADILPEKVKELSERYKALVPAQIRPKSKH